MEFCRCDECGRRIYKNESVITGADGKTFCCEGHKDIYELRLKQEEDRQEEKKKKEQEEEKQRRKDKIDATISNMNENLAYFDGEEIDSSLKGKKVLGRKVDRNILDKLEVIKYSVKDGKFNSRISIFPKGYNGYDKYASDQLGCTGLLQLRLEYINGNKKETAAKIFLNSISQIKVEDVDTESRYLDFSVSSPCKVPEVLNDDTVPCISLYELDDEKEWILCSSYKLKSKNEERIAEKKEQEYIKREKAAKEQRAKEAVKKQYNKLSRTLFYCILSAVPLWYMGYVNLGTRWNLGVAFVLSSILKLLPFAYSFLRCYEIITNKSIIPSLLDLIIKGKWKNIVDGWIISFLISSWLYGGNLILNLIKYGVCIAVMLVAGIVVKILLKACTKNFKYISYGITALVFVIPLVMYMI